MSQFAFHQQGASASPEVLTFFFCKVVPYFYILPDFLCSFWQTGMIKRGSLEAGMKMLL
jgi:hypothetical protein